MTLGCAGLTKIEVNAGNEGVEEKHEDHYTEDRCTLHQQNPVSYFVLQKQKDTFPLTYEKVIFITRLMAFVLSELSKTRPTSLLR